MKHEEITKKVIGCAMEVHSRLGNGFQEVIYQRALEYEMELNKIPFLENKNCQFFTRKNKLEQEELIF